MLDIRIEGQREIHLLLTTLATTLADFRRFFQEYLTPFIHAEIDNVFATEGFGGWDPLNPDYAARKAITHPGKGILEREGTYRTAATQVGATGSRVEMTATELVVGVDASAFPGNYPALHEEGLGGQRERSVFGNLIAQNPRFQEQVSDLAETYIVEEERLLARSLGR